MATKRTYPFTCGHNARATNEEAMRSTTHAGKKHRLCPRCWSRVDGQIARCLESGRRASEKRSHPATLPEEEI